MKIAQLKSRCPIFRHRLLAIIFSLLWCVLTACCGIHASTDTNRCVKDYLRISTDSLPQEMDSIHGVIIFNDSIDSIIKNHYRTEMFLMPPLIRDTSDISYHDSILGYPISYRLDSIYSKTISKIDSVLQDAKSYRSYHPSIRQPFNPDFSMKVSSKENATVYFFISLGSEEIAIADEQKNFKFYQVMKMKELLEYFEIINRQLNGI